MKDTDIDDFEDSFDDEPIDDQMPSEFDDNFNDDFSNLNYDMGDDFHGDVPMEKHNDLLKELTNFAPYLKDTVNGWLGLVWDETQSKYVPSEWIRPIMNRHCAAWCVSFLKTYARGNNIITDLNNDHYKNMMCEIIDTIWYNIGTRADLDFGIQEDGDILRIGNELEHAASLVLMGAGDGRYNKFLSGTMTSNYSGNFNGNMNQGNNYNPQMYQGNPSNPQKTMGTFAKLKKAVIG